MPGEEFTAVQPIVVQPNFGQVLRESSPAPVPLEKLRCFLIKSNNTANVDSSMSKGVWSAFARKNNSIYSGAYQSKIHVYFLFTVSSSSKFSGYCRMSSDVRYEPTMWNNGKRGFRQVDTVFNVEWINCTGIAFAKCKHVSGTIHGSFGKNAKDGTEFQEAEARALFSLMDAEVQASSSRPARDTATASTAQGAPRGRPLESVPANSHLAQLALEPTLPTTARGEHLSAYKSEAVTEEMRRTATPNQAQLAETIGARAGWEAATLLTRPVAATNQVLRSKVRVATPTEPAVTEVGI